jgi:hypothetical protein
MGVVAGPVMRWEGEGEVIRFGKKAKAEKPEGGFGRIK